MPNSHQMSSSLEASTTRGNSGHRRGSLKNEGVKGAFPRRRYCPEWALALGQKRDSPLCARAICKGRLGTCDVICFHPMPCLA